MKLFLTDQTRNFRSLLNEMIATPPMAFDKTKLRQKTSAISIDIEMRFDQIKTDFLFSYKIFPSTILTCLTQWETESRAMKVGDTILQQVMFPPIGWFSLKMIFGVRIVDIIHEPFRKGFTYVTLEGHVEKGESTFTLEEVDGGPIFRITTFSMPGNVMSQVLGPIFTLPYQAYCTRQALKNVRKQVLTQARGASAAP